MHKSFYFNCLLSSNVRNIVLATNSSSPNDYLIFLILSTFIGDTTNKDREIKKCLTEAYKKTDDDFLHEASKV